MKSREPLDQRNLVRSNGHELIDVTSSVLLVIDIQQPFLNKYDRAKTQALISKVSWLIGVAAHLDVPIVAMAEDIDRVENKVEKMDTRVWAILLLLVGAVVLPAIVEFVKNI